MRKIFVLISLIIPYAITQAQDAHFTQFENSPFFINPGSAGMLEHGDYRGNLNTRNQWRALVKPATHTMLSADLPVLRFLGPTPSKSYLGVGGYFSFATMGDTRTKQNAYGIAVNGITTVGKGKKLGLGFGAGRGSLRADLNGSTWDAQYNGYSYDNSLPTKEPLDGGYRAKYWDFSTGLNFLATHNKTGNTTNMGIAYLHLNNPKLKKTEMVNGRVEPRLVFHMRTEIQLKMPHSLPMYFIPRLLFANQGAHNEIQAGLSLFLVTNKISERINFHHKEGIEMGAMFRYNDAVGLIAGYKTENWKLGVSYDITISQLGEAVKRRGGTELCFIYVGRNPNLKQKQTFY